MLILQLGITRTSWQSMPDFFDKKVARLWMSTAAMLVLRVWRTLARRPKFAGMRHYSSCHNLWAGLLVLTCGPRLPSERPIEIASCFLLWTKGLHKARTRRHLACLGLFPTPDRRQANSTCRSLYCVMSLTSQSRLNSICSLVSRRAREPTRVCNAAYERHMSSDAFGCRGRYVGLAP